MKVPSQSRNLAACMWFHDIFKADYAGSRMLYANSYMSSNPVNYMLFAIVGDRFAYICVCVCVCECVCWHTYSGIRIQFWHICAQLSCFCGRQACYETCTQRNWSAMNFGWKSVPKPLEKWCINHKQSPFVLLIAQISSNPHQISVKTSRKFRKFWGNCCGWRESWGKVEVLAGNCFMTDVVSTFRIFGWKIAKRSVSVTRVCL